MRILKLWRTDGTLIYVAAEHVTHIQAAQASGNSGPGTLIWLLNRSDPLKVDHDPEDVAKEVATTSQCHSVTRSKTAKT